MGFVAVPAGNFSFFLYYNIFFFICQVNIFYEICSSGRPIWAVVGEMSAYGMLHCVRIPAL